MSTGCGGIRIPAEHRAYCRRRSSPRCPAEALVAAADAAARGQLPERGVSAAYRLGRTEAAVRQRASRLRLRRLEEGGEPPR